MKLYIVYETDNWHTNDSRECVAYCDSIDNCLKAIDDYAKTHKLGEVSAEDKKMLRDTKQTHGYGEYTEFLIEECELNLFQ